MGTHNSSLLLLVILCAILRNFVSSQIFYPSNSEDEGAKETSRGPKVLGNRNVDRSGKVYYNQYGPDRHFTNKPIPNPNHPKTETQDPNKLTKSFEKPFAQDWVRGRSSHDKRNLISWLIDGCYFYNMTESKHPIVIPKGVSKCPFADHPDLNPDNSNAAPEFQTFDGFYNNIFKVDLGAVDTALLRRAAPVYHDGVYEPVKKNRINPFEASKLMTRSAACGTNGKTVACGSKTGKSAFLVYFGQQVVEEMLDAQRPGCPPEYFNIDIPEDHEYRRKNETGKTKMPFLRSRWDQKTGHSPGNPRQQLNEITPWIDGGLVYGTSKAWSDVLRTRVNGSVVENGLLASEDDLGLFPVQNKLRLPMANPPPPAQHDTWAKRHETAKVNRFFVLGNPRGNENAFLLSFGVVLFRWHNHIATYLAASRPLWSGERVFQEARKWVIAIYQQMVMYEWLVEWLGESLEPYTVYDPSVDPQIEQFFQTAAMRFGHTLVTPGAYMRDYAHSDCKHIPFLSKGCSSSNGMTCVVRTCNIFWRPQEPLKMKHKNNNEDDGEIADIDRLLMGMASQRAEREDNMIVEDLRGRVFGPLEFSRRDLMAVNIQRGRDHGTPDYNTARESLGLSRISSVDEYIQLTNTHTPRNIVEKMEKIHEIYTDAEDKKNKIGSLTNDDREKIKERAWNNIDVWTGGILETSDRPGPLFRSIIKDQFNRIRNADRFWFENKQWKISRFSLEQIERIKTIRVYDMIMSVTKMNLTDLQPNPFRVPTKEFVNKYPESTCFKKNNLWKTSECYKPTYFPNGTLAKQIIEKCYYFPQLDSDEVKIERCTTPSTYDYFTGSEISFILTFLCIGLLITGIGSLVPMMASLNRIKKTPDSAQSEAARNSFKLDGMKIPPYAAREWVNKKDGKRAVVVVVTDKGKMEIRSHRAELLRCMDFSTKSSVEFILVNDGLHLVIKNPAEYDCVLEFEGRLIRDSFFSVFKQKMENSLTIVEQSGGLNQSLNAAITKDKRLERLEKFFKIVFAQAFGIDQPSGTKDLVDPKVIREAIYTELTPAEFSDALGMKSGSQFVEKMFNLVDHDRNGYISFREFLDMLIIFAKGTAEDKAKLMFEMYDIKRTGTLTTEEFTSMIRSMVEAANADVDNEEIDDLVQCLLESANVNRHSEVHLENFQKLMSEHKETLGYAHLNFSGVNVPETQAGSRKSYYNDARSTVISIYGSEASEARSRMNTSDSGKLGKSKKYPAGDNSFQLEEKSVHYQKNKFFRWIELYRLKIFWLILYTLVVIAIFAERAYTYSIEREHGGLRQIAGYGVTVTRGAASVMMFTYATLLLTMCRNLITNLRETFLHRIIPFDSFVVMHKYVACLAIIFSVIHVIGHSINFYHISTQTSSDLSCIFREYHWPTHVLPKFHFWCFQTITGFTGVLLVVHVTLLSAFSTNYARTHAFRMFWITHTTYPLLYVLMILHGMGRLVQEPIFLNFLLGPLFLFILDRLMTTSRKKVEIPVIRVELLPSNVTKLEFSRPNGFEYKSGQWVRVACKALHAGEFHPFTLSSAPHEPNLTVHIRAVGPFTTNIRQIYERSLPKLYLDGPYGEGHQDWWRYEVSILVGGGIGVTPFASILKDVAANSNGRNCKKIYFIWVTRTQKQFEWLVDIIREVEVHDIISVHVFITQIYDKFDLRTVLLYICERHFQRVNNKSLFTGLKSVTHFGRPNFKSFLSSLKYIHPNVTKFGVFSCGPLPMTKTVDEACTAINNVVDSEGNDAVFQHHFENF